MCGILGYIQLKGGHFDQHTKSDLTFLLNYSEDRGDHATGVAFFKDALDDGEMRPMVYYKKDAIPATKFTSLDFWRDLELPSLLIGHTRWATKGATSNPNNNHPIIGKGMALVHNGVIDNDEDVFEDFKLPRSGLVDSEVILRLLEENIHTFGMEVEDAIKAASKELEGKFACAFITDTRPGELFLFRHDNPIEVGYIEELGLIVFASQREFIADAFAKVTMKMEYFFKKHPRYEIMYRTMENDSGLTIDQTGIKEIYSIESKEPWYKSYYQGYSGFGTREGRSQYQGRNYSDATRTISRNQEYVKLYTCPKCATVNTEEVMEENNFLCETCQHDMVHYTTESLNMTTMLRSEWEAINEDNKTVNEFIQSIADDEEAEDFILDRGGNKIPF